MRLAIQIFRKDVERSRWAILLTLALLGYWTFRDATLGWTPDPAVLGLPSNNWLSLILPFAWTVLIALAVHEDSLVGDRQFWAALPCGWKPLFAAKVAFIAAFVHLPYFIATAAILFGRGFNPVAHLPHLFWKQVVLLALTIPAFAAATLVRKVGHFLLLVIVVASAVVLRGNQFNQLDSQMWVWDIRWNLTLIVLAVGAILVTALQFIRRCTRVSRAVGVVTAIAAACLYVWIPRDVTAAISAAFSPAPQSAKRAAIRLESGISVVSPPAWGFQTTAVALPLILEWTNGLQEQTDLVSLEMTTASGVRYDIPPVRNVNPDGKGPVAAMLLPAGPHGQLRETLYFYNAALWARVRGERVTLRGRMIVEYSQPRQSVGLRAGEFRDVDSLGHCRSTRLPGFSNLRRYASSLECDSVEVGGRDLRVGTRFVDFVAMNSSLEEHLYGVFSGFPQDQWLSPLHRSRRALGGMSDLTLALTPLLPRGFEIVDFTLPNIDLNQFAPGAR